MRIYWAGPAERVVWQLVVRGRPYHPRTGPADPDPRDPDGDSEGDSEGGGSPAGAGGPDAGAHAARDVTRIETVDLEPAVENVTRVTLVAQLAADGRAAGRGRPPEVSVWEVVLWGLGGEDDAHCAQRSAGSQQTRLGPE